MPAELDYLKVTAEEAALIRNTVGSDHPAARFLDKQASTDDLAFKTNAFLKLSRAVKAENELIKAVIENEELHGEFAEVGALRKKLAKANLDVTDLRNALADKDNKLAAAKAKNAMAS